MKSRKGRLIWLGIYFFMFLTLTVLYFSNEFFTAEQDTKMIQLMAYTSLIFIIVLLAEWLAALDKESPRYKKYIFTGIVVIWFIFLWILFGDMIF